MKSLRKVLVTMIAVTFVLSMAMSTVKAVPATDLKSLKVYSVDTTGAKKKIKFKFNPTTYKYDLVVKSNVPRIEVIPATNDATSTAVVDKEALNTRMDTGMNRTTVTVTSSTGAKQVYTLKTKKLTPAEDANYKEESSKKTKKTSKKSAKIDINGKEYKITSFKKKDIPRGFVATTAKYKGKKYDAIKGKEKDLTAFNLSGDNGEAFYIYDKDQDKFYKMNNVKVKSRMYTIVEPAKVDDILKNYATKNIKIDGQKTKAWILDEEKGLFFVYAMNWDGDTSLYTYDDQEKCMQRYLVDNDVNSQIEAANKAYDNMKAKRNAMAKKYNIFRYIIIGMAVIIVILIFIIIHRGLKRKEKKIKDEEFVTAGMGDGPKEDKNDESKEEVVDKDDIDAVPDENDIDAAPVVDENDIDAVPDEADAPKEDASDEVDEPVVDVAEVESIMEENEADMDDDDDIEFIDIDDLDDEPNFEEPVAEEIISEEPKTEEPVDEMPVVETPEESPKEEQVAEPEVERTPEENTHEKKRAFSKVQKHEGYGDEPTFGTDKESSEGFYGGEVKDEQEVLVDITDDDEPELAEPIENMVAEKEIQDTADIDVDSINEPEDLKSTLKSMLGDDDDDEDDDFEFIDLN